MRAVATRPSGDGNLVTKVTRKNNETMQGRLDGGAIRMVDMVVGCDELGVSGMVRTKIEGLIGDKT